MDSYDLLDELCIAHRFGRGRIFDEGVVTLRGDPHAELVGQDPAVGFISPQAFVLVEVLDDRLCGRLNLDCDSSRCRLQDLVESPELIAGSDSTSRCWAFWLFTDGPSVFASLVATNSQRAARSHHCAWPGLYRLCRSTGCCPALDSRSHQLDQSPLRIRQVRKMGSELGGPSCLTTCHAPKSRENVTRLFNKFFPRKWAGKPPHRVTSSREISVNQRW